MSVASCVGRLVWCVCFFLRRFLGTVVTMLMVEMLFQRRGVWNNCVIAI